MKPLIAFALAATINLTLLAQPAVNYDDVAVIINSNSSVSIEVGEYFQDKRGIPDLNMIYIDVPEQTVIDSAQFEDLRSQVEDYLVSNGIQDSINYLVTTKGVPLRVEYGSCSITESEFAKCHSVDSDLCLILGADSASVGASGGVMNSYFLDTNHFDRATYDYYLVTRLTAYNHWDIKAMINRSGPGTVVYDLTDNIIFDLLKYSSSGDSAALAGTFSAGIDFSTAQGWSTVYHGDTSIATGYDNVLFYHSIHSGAIDEGATNNFTKGSVGIHFGGHTGYTFDEVENPTDLYILSDMLRDGCTSGYASTNLDYISMNPRSEQFLLMYMDTVSKYNFAEAMYSSIRSLSWQGVVVGDPKTTLVFDEFALLPPPQDFNEFRLYPNPNHGDFTVKLDGYAKGANLVIHDLQGRLLHSQKLYTEMEINFDLDFRPGVYVLSIIGEDYQQRVHFVLR